MSKSKKVTYDKCQICGFTGKSNLFIDNKCPICGSEDVDDADFDPYNDDDDENEELWD